MQNLSQHTGLTLPRLLGELGSLKQPLSAADVILVGIAHNSFELNADAPCGRPVINNTPVWSVVGARCAAKSAAKYRPMYQKLYAQIAPGGTAGQRSCAPTTGTATGSGSRPRT